MDTPRPPLLGRPVPAKARPAAIVWLFAAIVVCMLGLTLYSSHLLSSGRAFIAAEGQWSKAQKDAVYHLARYAAEFDERDLAEYRRALAVVEGFRDARLEFAKPRPDLAAVRHGLIAGGVHESDVDKLLRLHDRFRHFGPLDHVLMLWQRSDALVAQLRGVGEELAADGPTTEPERAARLARTIDDIDRAIEPLEAEFAATLAETQRTAQVLLDSGILIVSGLLLIGGILASRRFLDQNARLQRTLAANEEQLRQLVASAPLPLLVVRAAGHRLAYANERALEQIALGPSAEGRALGELFVESASRDAVMAELSRSGAVRDAEVQLQGLAGRPSWFLLSAQPVRYQGDVCLLVSAANIDDRKRLQDDMRRKAMHDPLTGLPNRAMFLEALERAMARARRHHIRFSVLFIDLDRFKEVNDTMGHQAGDALLKIMAQRLGTAVRGSDLVARLGGDEFVILVEEHGGPEEVMIVAQKALGLLERPVTIDWREAEVSGSIGIASFPEDGADVDALVRNADIAMYQAKERGRNNFQFYSEDMNRLSLRRLEQERRVRGALERGEFFLEYQPEVDLADGRVTALEALLRWRDPEAGVVTASEFMPLAEETGAVAAIGLWALDRALADFARWRAGGLGARLAVNLAARQAEQQDLAEDLRGLLERHGVPGDCLRVEITETTLLADSEAVHRTLRALTALGVQIAIDNFGAGWSSLGLVRGLPVHVVKVDRSLVSSCPARRECAAIVQAVASMARVMGIRVVAQGVETEEQRAAMAALGCDAAQGYLFAPPRPASEVEIKSVVPA